MALFYKFRQNNDNTKPKAYKKWFARAVHTETVGIRELSEQMQCNSTVKRSDILAVLSELADTMTSELQSGRKVYLEGIGTFMLGISSRGCDHARDFRTDRDVVDVHVVFQPDTYKTRNGVKRHALTDGTRLVEMPHYRKPE
ncbi:MAG: HU family DNA-binding protein [Prevotella sp.]|nr:HU family DNA-binding protein [Prevotella sp.]